MLGTRITGVSLSLALVGCGGDPQPAADAGTGTTEGSSGSVSTGTATTVADATGSESGGETEPGGSGTSTTTGVAACEDSLPADAEAPERLSQTGLYADIVAKTVADNVQPFAPQFELWSDAALKNRWVYVPECGLIDSSDMDDWSLPVGTRLWKEFVVDGVRVETRLVERVGEGPHDFVFAAYVWNDDETEATIAPDGVEDARGTTHDVPAEAACRQCHGSDTEGGGRPSRALGFSALQLAGDTPGLNLDGLVAADLLTDLPEGAYDVPGTTAERAALGYLHANCGNCHNATVDAAEPIDLDLWVSVDDVSVDDTGAYRTAVGVANTLFNDQHVTARIEPGLPDQSAVAFRMGERGNTAQMPPIATETVDGTGLDIVALWIEGLP